MYKKTFILIIMFGCALGAYAQTKTSFWYLTPDRVDTSSDWINGPRKVFLPAEYREARNIYFSGKNHGQAPTMPQHLKNLGLSFVVINQDHSFEFIDGEQAVGKTDGIAIARSGTWFIYDSKKGVYIYPPCLNRLKFLVKLPEKTVREIVRDTVYDTLVVPGKPIVGTSGNAKNGSSSSSGKSGSGGAVVNPTNLNTNGGVYREVKTVSQTTTVSVKKPNWRLIIIVGAIVVVGAGIIYALTNGKVKIEPHHTTSDGGGSSTTNDDLVEDHHTTK